MRDNHLALWAAVSAFFGSILAIGAIDILTPGDRAQFIGAVFVAAITAGAVYAKQKLDDAKQGRVHAGTLVVRETEDRKVYSLEVDGDVENLDTKKEVVFRVRKA